MKLFGVLFLVCVSTAAVQSYSVDSSASSDGSPSVPSSDPTVRNGTSQRLRAKRAPVLPVILPAVIGMAAGLTGIAAGGVTIGKAAQGERCRDAGCHEGYCWAWCGITHDHGEWCYTTKTYSQSYKYVSCSTDSDCNGCWHCAGPCTL